MIVMKKNMIEIKKRKKTFQVMKYKTKVLLKLNMMISLFQAFVMHLVTYLFL